MNSIKFLVFVVLILVGCLITTAVYNGIIVIRCIAVAGLGGLIGYEISTLQQEYGSTKEEPKEAGDAEDTSISKHS